MKNLQICRIYLGTVSKTEEQIGELGRVRRIKKAAASVIQNTKMHIVLQFEQNPHNLNFDVSHSSTIYTKIKRK